MFWRAERRLLSLGEEIIYAAIENQSSNGDDGHILFRNEFGGIKDVECELVRERVVE